MKTSALLSALLASFLLVACADDLPSEPVAQPAAPFPFIRLSPSSPPDTPFEQAPINYEPGKQVWRKGHWSYDGKDFAWISGTFIEKPHPTAAWTPDRWEKRQFGWAFIPGYWQ